MSTPFGVTVRSYIPKKASTHVRPAEAPLSYVRSIQFSRKSQLLGVAVQDLDSVVQVARVVHEYAVVVDWLGNQRFCPQVHYDRSSRHPMPPLQYLYYGVTPAIPPVVYGLDVARSSKLTSKGLNLGTGAKKVHSSLPFAIEEFLARRRGNQ